MASRIIFYLRKIFIFPIFLYKKIISPLLPNSCIYSPSCSSYGMESIMKHGIFKGTALGITRIFRCAGGLFTGGEDPVPEIFSFRYITGAYKEFRQRKEK